MLELVAVVVSIDGTRAVRASARGPRTEAAALGRQVADALVSKGAAEILSDARSAQGAVQGLQP
jgi:hydroxymethylbilane synthase